APEGSAGPGTGADKRWEGQAMAILLLVELKPGMRLARGVLSPQGALLANPGDQLTDKQIRLFKMWGVTEVEVAETSPEAGAEPQIEDEEAAVPEDEIDLLFADHLDDPVMYQIATFAKQIVAQRKS
ncbi:MAG: hypothetical protein KGJ86_11900, partial [Chloroflexota bacterium]|nr:hypothetical protein [Chloroflexota bacterium]